jgi:LPS sulfotransferase NodH
MCSKNFLSSGLPVKFILLGHPRSGSTLVTVALQSHPDIRMFGELFHPEFQNRLIAYQWGIQRRPSGQMFPERTKAWCYTEHQEGDRFLEELVFGDSSPDCPPAIGFKFFYDHAQDARARSAWSYLCRHEEVRIVHLVRENLLDCLLSTRTAERTAVWEVEIDDPVPAEPSPFAISPAECDAYFDWMIKLRRQAEAQLFGNRQILQLTYEQNIRTDFGNAMRRIQEFLGVTPTSLSPRLQKQSRSPAQARIENYSELSRHFEHTPFHAFFTTPELPHA